MASSARLAILGIDPGTRWAGLAVVRGDGRLVDRARLDLAAMAREPDDPNSRIHALHRAVSAWVARYQPAILAVENPAHPRNPHTAQMLGRAVAACVLPALELGAVVLEYRPGQARRVLGSTPPDWSDDERVALAVARLALREYLDGVRP